MNPSVTNPNLKRPSDLSDNFKSPPLKKKRVDVELKPVLIDISKYFIPLIVRVRLDLTLIEPLTHKSYFELMQEQFVKGLPFSLSLVQDQGHPKFYYFSASHLLDLCKNGLNPLTKKKIETVFYCTIKEHTNTNKDSFTCLGNFNILDFLRTYVGPLYNPVEKFNLAERSFYGKGTERNIKVAVFWYLESANEGYSEAEFLVGSFYSEGKYLERNYVESASWYKKAANHGHSKAQFMLGCFYKLGLGVPHDTKEAVQLVVKSAENGYVNAQYTLGEIYEIGEDAAKNLNKAFYWYTKAAENNHEQALMILSYSYSRGRCIEQDFDKAIEWALKGFNLGNFLCGFNLCIFYSSGKNPRKNLEKAEEYSNHIKIKSLLISKEQFDEIIDFYQIDPKTMPLQFKEAYNILPKIGNK